MELRCVRAPPKEGGEEPKAECATRHLMLSKVVTWTTAISAFWKMRWTRVRTLSAISSRRSNRAHLETRRGPLRRPPPKPRTLHRLRRRLLVARMESYLRGELLLAGSLHRRLAVDIARRIWVRTVEHGQGARGTRGRLEWRGVGGEGQTLDGKFGGTEGWWG